MSASGLARALQDFEAYRHHLDPGWDASLPRGLGDAGLRAAEAQLEPYRLTEEQRVLYEWHDGDGGSGTFGDDLLPYLSLADAVEWWRFGHGELEWTPCWMPLLNTGQYYSLALVDRVSTDESAILELFLQDEPRIFVPSIEALVRWHLDCLRRGIHVISRADGAPDGAAEDSVRRAYERPVQVRGEPLQARLSVGFARTWPRAWREAIGIDVAASRPLGADTTIAELLAGSRTSGIIEGRVVTGGFGAGALVEVDDGTARALVGCPAGIPGLRELGSDLVVEMNVGVATGAPFPELTFLTAMLGSYPLVAESVRFVRSLRTEDR